MEGITGGVAASDGRMAKLHHHAIEVGDGWHKPMHEQVKA